MNKKVLRSSVTAFFAALLVTLVVLLLIGKNPLSFLWVIFSAFFTDSTGTLLSGFIIKSVPILFAGLGVAFAFQTGMFNIGAEGQVTMGIFGALAIGLIPGIPTIIHLPLTILGAAFMGAIWGFIPGILKAIFQVHEVVITIMMNYIALYLMKDWLLKYFADPEKAGTQTKILQESVLLKSFGQTKIFGIPANYLVYFAIGILGVVLFSFIINKTKLGFELRTVGKNIDAANYAGMKTKRNMALSMTIAGAFAGVGGAFFLFSTSLVATEGFVQTGIGFDGLAAALLGGSTGIGTYVSSLILSYLDIVSLEIQHVLSVPKEVTAMITSLILFFIAMSYMFDLLWDKTLKIAENKDKKDKKLVEGEVE